MSVSFSRNIVAYGVGQPTVALPPSPIASKRVPTEKDFAPIGTLWTCTITDCAWILAAIIENEAHWTPITVNAGARVLDGDVVVEDGNAIVGLDVYCRTLYTQGDSGVAVAGAVGITNVLDTDLSTGRLWIRSKTHLFGENEGFIKVYVDGNEAWLPYFRNISPSSSLESTVSPILCEYHKE
jgi:hypothetical protein